ncbi:hypothetical protein AAFX24_28510 [Vibrio mediterranei]|uniref:hypothetical protein n=1 Tax=Vibrio mediterranei TaxID=689 RepID=UPI0038CDD9C5
MNFTINMTELKRTIELQTQNFASNHRLDERQANIDILWTFANAINKGVLNCQIEKGHHDIKVEPAIADILRAFYALFPSDETSPVVSEYQLELDSLGRPFPDFDGRYKANIGKLTIGVSNEAVDAFYATDGFNDRALQFEREVYAPFHLMKQAEFTRIGQEKSRVYSKHIDRKLDDISEISDALGARTVLLDLIESAVEAELSIYSDQRLAKKIAQAFKVAASYYLTACEELSLMRISLQEGLMSNLTALPAMSPLYFARKVTLTHAAMGFFDFEVYWSFFKDYIIEQNNAPDTDNFYYMLDQQILRPCQYLQNFYVEALQDSDNGDTNSSIVYQTSFIVFELENVINPDGKSYINLKDESANPLVYSGLYKGGHLSEFG